MMPQHLDVLDNPRVILEVLSPSTEAFDRGEKRERSFQHLESLAEYLLIAQDHPAIEHWRKDPDGLWHSIIVKLLTLHATTAVLSHVPSCRSFFPSVPLRAVALTSYQGLPCAAPSRCRHPP